MQAVLDSCAIGVGPWFSFSPAALWFCHTHSKSNVATWTRSCSMLIVAQLYNRGYDA